MKVCHVISSISKNAGGTTEYVRLLVNSIGYKITQSIIYYKSDKDVLFDVNIKEIPAKRGGGLFSRNNYLEKLNTVDADLFHGNGLWLKPTYYMVKNALKKEIPYIISTHGMLESWSLNQGKLKKKIALGLYQYSHLKNANCLHATASMEVNSIRSLGLKNPIAMIPNGIDVSIFEKKPPIKINNPKEILFLSRIHPKKGIENLIESWGLINEELRKGWVVNIVGNGDLKYIESLKDKVKSNKLENQIRIKKPVFGQEKLDLYKRASLFVLPTFSENFGIVIAEALASYTPVITTKGTPWDDLIEYNCGWWIDIGVDPLRITLEDAIKRNEKELLSMGENGRRLIEEKYSMESVSEKMLELYDWIINNKKKPNFII